MLYLKAVFCCCPVVSDILKGKEIEEEKHRIIGSILSIRREIRERGNVADFGRLSQIMRLEDELSNLKGERK